MQIYNYLVSQFRKFCGIYFDCYRNIAVFVGDRKKVLTSKLTIMKHKRFYLIKNSESVNYTKLESELPFGIDEGIKILEKSNPDATEIKHLNKKAIKFLNLK